jgi:putative transposase
MPTIVVGLSIGVAGVAGLNVLRADDGTAAGAGDDRSVVPRGGTGEDVHRARATPPRRKRGVRVQGAPSRRRGGVLNALPKSAQPGAKAALAEIWNAEDREHAQKAATVFASQYGAKWPKAVAKITDDLDVLLEFYNYPAEHWVHLRTTNPIESTFATVRLRQRVTKGPGSRAAGIAMAFKLIESAQARWRAVNAPHLVALVRAGAAFERGILIERPEDTNPESGGDQQVA